MPSVNGPKTNKRLFKKLLLFNKSRYFPHGKGFSTDGGELCGLPGPFCALHLVILLSKCMV